MRTLELRIPPVIVVLAVGACMWAAARVLPVADSSHRFRLQVALVLAGAGAAIAAAGVITFRRAKTTVNPLKPGASQLVSTGVYAFTRNPMYLGMALILLAWAVYLSSVASLFGPAIFVAYVTKYQIIPEERVLAGIFGPRFSEYQKRVRRWI